MTDERDFAIDEGELQAATYLPADSPPPPDPASAVVPAHSPRVVIQYRNRGLHAALLPPLLILVAAIGITSYQRQARLRPAPPPELRAKPAGTASGASPAAPRGRIIMVEPAGTGAAVEPITIRSATAPPPLPTTASDPTANEPAVATAPLPPPATAPAEPDVQGVLADTGRLAVSSPFAPVDRETRPTDAPPLEPPAPLTSSAGGPLSLDSPELAFAPADVVAALTRARKEPVAREPAMTKEQILQGIQEEAQHKKAEQANLGREVEASRAREFLETIRKAHDDRQPFHDELRRLLRELGKDAGAEIKNLCDRYGRATHPEVEKVVTRSLNRSGARVHRDAKIRLLRLQGCPEPLILDELAKDLDLQIRGKRGGPRDQNGVRVQAAILLLNYPPPALPESGFAADSGTHTSAAVRTPATP